MVISQNRNATRLSDPTECEFQSEFREYTRQAVDSERRGHIYDHDSKERNI